MEPPRKKAQKRYRTVQAAIRDGWPEDLDGVDLTLANYNLLAEFAAELFRVNPARDADEVRKVSLDTFKNMSDIRGGKWVVNPTYTLASGIEFQNPYSPQPNLEKLDRGRARVA